MSRQTRDKRSRKRGLTKDDLAVWDHVAKGVKPMLRAPDPKADRDATDPLGSLEREFATRLRATQGTPEDQAVGRMAISAQKSKPADGESKPSNTRPPGQGRPTAKRVKSNQSTVSTLDAKLAKKIRRGQADIDARLDLHGMTQAMAHASLRRFVVRCVAQNMRTVLIITGKGREEQDRDGDDWWSIGDREPKGVLRRNLPSWLADPALRPLVVGYETAAPQHGGSGAFYVRLRRNKQV